MRARVQAGGTRCTKCNHGHWCTLPASPPASSFPRTTAPEAGACGVAGRRIERARPLTRASPGQRAQALVNNLLLGQWEMARALLRVLHKNDRELCKRVLSQMITAPDSMQWSVPAAPRYRALPPRPRPGCPRRPPRCKGPHRRAAKRHPRR